MYLDNAKKYLILIAQVAMILVANGVFASEPLLPGDQVHIWVKGEPDLTVDRTIGRDGSINFPLIGMVKIGGLTPSNAAKGLARRLDDGYIREPLVQINRIGSTALPPEVRVRPAEPVESQFPARQTDNEMSTVSAAPLVFGDDSREPQIEVPLRQPRQSAPVVPSLSYVEIIDGKTGSGIRKAVMLFNGKIFQTNSAGQMKLDAPHGPLILMADGYQVVQGQLQHFLKPGAMPKIVMDQIRLADEIEVKVLDVSTNLPLTDVLVKLNGVRVKTNQSGIFRIKQMKAEYSEIELSKKGFQTVRQIIDSKDGRPRTVALVPQR